MSATLSFDSLIADPSKRGAKAAAGPSVEMISLGRTSASLTDCLAFRATWDHAILALKLALMVGSGKHYVVGEQGTIEKYSEHSLPFYDVDKNHIGVTHFYPFERRNVTLAGSVWVDGFCSDSEGYIEGMNDFLGAINAAIPGLGLQVRRVNNGSVNGGDRKTAVVIDVQGGLGRASRTADKVLKRCSWALQQLKGTGRAIDQSILDAIQTVSDSAYKRINGDEPAVETAASEETAPETVPAPADSAEQAPARGRRSAS